MAAEEKIDRHFFKRLGKLLKIRRFLISWVILILLLCLAVFLQFLHMKHQAEKLVFVNGGIFSEGIVGEYTNINPIYASGSVDTSAAKLIFSGLFTYNSQGNLVPDLAKTISVDDTEKIYTVILKDKLTWQDGQPLTAKDVEFTFNTIKLPKAESFLYSGWKDIEVKATDDRTVVFTLRDTLSSFPHSLTTGIIPKHVLSGVAPEKMRASEFNTVNPVGSGPFAFDVVEASDMQSEGLKKQQVGLVAFSDYHMGKPKLNKFIIKTYETQEELEKAYNEKKVQAIGGLFPTPFELTDSLRNKQYSLPLSAQVMIFFKTSEGVLSDPNVRKALVLGSSRKDIIKSVGFPLQTNDSPFLSSHISYNKNLVQSTNNPEEAKKILDQAGWLASGDSGIRQKDGVPLRFQLYAENSAEYTKVAKTLQHQLKNIGVEMKVNLRLPDELKATIADHNYDALLSAISTGADPDIFAYWHSSQSQVLSRSRLNFSEYNSSAGDEALVAGRSRSDPKIRAVKYEPFLKEWLKDNPALALYQPVYTYIVRSPFQGIDSKRLIAPSDRYSEVEKWAIKQDKVL